MYIYIYIYIYIYVLDAFGAPGGPHAARAPHAPPLNL